MKTAVSIPDELFREADELAHRLGKSRSEVYASRIATTVLVPLTGNLRLVAAPGNVVLPAPRTGLPKDSVVNVSHSSASIAGSCPTLSATCPRAICDFPLAGIDLALDRE